MYRDHTCGELRKGDLGKEAKLAGWVQSRRDHGGLIFIDLRDRYGLTQVVFDPALNKETHSEAEKLRREDVIGIVGKVRERKPGMQNPKLATGEIEVICSKIEILNRAETPPLEVDDRIEGNEEIRLKYRYIDLRRPIMQQRLAFRHNVVTAVREYMNNHDFLEIETPLLVRATPEGARDYVVPSRVNPGKFYALPQSPQLYKQILMVSGCDRYYQIARCLRDEDLRADRQPEHTQIDLEMSFVHQEDILQLVEGLYKHIVKKTLGVEIKEKFPRFSWQEAMNRFGVDKPDLRFGMELIDVAHVAKKSDFEIFKKAEHVKCLNPERDFSRKEIDELTQFVASYGAKGLAWIKVTDKGLESSITKYLKPEVQKELLEATKAKKGSTLFFMAGNFKTVHIVLGQLRNELARRMEIIKPGELKFCWVIDWPLFEWNEEEQKWDSMHHIFSRPSDGTIQYLESDLSKVIGLLHDLVLNGLELGSGSIRINQPEMQEKVMKVIGLSHEEAMKKFGFLLEAFKYGAPPHGGMGLGVDRISALLLGFSDIREVIAFPKNKNAECPMDGCPSDVPPETLKDLHLKIDIVKKKT
ncbi:MAG: aspartate--tRNA ligase [Candidatus Woesearchaeota archaeon]